MLRLLPSALALLATCTSALPNNETRIKEHALLKRTNPLIGPGWTSQQIIQIADAFKDAMELASYVVTLPSFDTDPIMAKYFVRDEFDTVKGVFSNILGSNSQGNSLLANIEIIQDPGDGKGGNAVCTTSKTYGALGWPDSAKPLMVLCPYAFTFGGIGKGYNLDPNSIVNAVQCGNFDNEINTKVDVLGATLLHEYTHFKSLVSPPLSGGTDDIKYNPYNVQNMDKTRAVNNADSYMWFALELLWSRLCNKPNGFAAALKPTQPSHQADLKRQVNGTTWLIHL